LQRGSIAVHFWHLAVHEDQVVRDPANRLQRFEAVRHDIDPEAELFQHPAGNPLIDDVVFGQQDVRAVAWLQRDDGAAGRS